MTVKNHDIIEVGVVLDHETEKAWLVISQTTGKRAWVPKSIGELTGEAPCYELQIPEWFANDKELI